MTFDNSTTKKMTVSSLSLGDTINDIFLLNAAQQGQARNGPYWRLECKDATGSIPAKIWSPLSQALPHLEPGMFVVLEGKVTSYKETLELAIDSLQILPEEAVQQLYLPDFLPASPYNIEAMFEELKELCKQTMTHKPWLKFTNLLLNDPEINEWLKIAPAAKNMHHAYVGGLLEHTLSVSQVCMLLATHYPFIDRQVLLAGAICHDIGKLWELQYNTTTEYSTAGKLIGHISIAIEKITPFIKKSSLEPELAEHLQHLILSHHGTHEFGSPRLPSTAEAILLHYADNIDAKMQQTQNALADIPQGESGWSGYIPAFERSIYRAPQSPGSQISGMDEKKKPSSPTQQQFSLLS